MTISVELLQLLKVIGYPIRICKMCHKNLIYVAAGYGTLSYTCVLALPTVLSEAKATILLYFQICVLFFITAATWMTSVKQLTGGN